MNALQQLIRSIIDNIKGHKATGVILGGYRHIFYLVMDIFMDKYSFPIFAPDRVQVQLRPKGTIALVNGHTIFRNNPDVLFQLLVKPLETAAFICNDNHLRQIIQGVVGSIINIADYSMAIVGKFLTSIATPFIAEEQGGAPYHQ